MHSSDASRPHPQYRLDIDGLRAVAVLSVILYHAYPSLLLGGFAGVDVFFVISGYLIAAIIFQHIEENRFSIAAFYSRRIRRIFPALLLVLCSCLTFGWFGLLGPEYAQLGKHVLSSAAFIANLTFWGEAGYFDIRSEFKPLLHLWSLGVEEQFYIFWPIICGLLVTRTGRPLFWMILLFCLSFAFNLYAIRHDASAAFYSPIGRFWELLAGAMLAWRTRHGDVLSDRFSTRQRDALSLGGAGLLAAGFLLINPDRSFPGWWAVLPVAGALLVIAAGPGAWFNRVILSNKVAVWFGLISYPLYLWHWPLLSINWIAEGTKPAILARGYAVLAAFILAWLTWRFVERPIRAGAGRHLILGLVGANLAVAVAGAAVYLQDGFVTRNAVTRSGVTEAVSRQITGALWQYSTNRTCLDEYPFEESATFRWWFCIKSSQRPPTVILLGNSFANQLYPGFVNNPLFGHHTFLSIGACDVGATTDRTTDGRSPCHGARPIREFDFLAGLIDRATSIRFAIIDGLNNDPDPAYIMTLKRRIDLLEAKGIRVVIFTPHIKPGFFPKACFSTPLRPVPRDCTFPAVQRATLLARFRPLVDAISASNPRVLFFEQNEIYCPDGDHCSLVRDGLPLHRDDTHISEYASIGLQPYFTRWVRDNLPEFLELPHSNP